MYKQNTTDLANAEKAYNDMMAMTVDEYAELNGLTYDTGAAAQQLKMIRKNSDRNSLKQKQLLVSQEWQWQMLRLLMMDI